MKNKFTITLDKSGNIESLFALYGNTYKSSQKKEVSNY